MGKTLTQAGINTGPAGVAFVLADALKLGGSVGKQDMKSSGH